MPKPRKSDHVELYRLTIRYGVREAMRRTGHCKSSVYSIVKKIAKGGK